MHPNLTHSQILLPVNTEYENSFASFLPGDNIQLIDALQNMVRGESDQTSLYLWGESGSGKTHLLHSCGQLANQIGRDNFYFSAAGQINNISQQNIAADALVCVDNFIAQAAAAEWQNLVFGLYEKLRLYGNLIVAGDKPIGALNLTLKDLASRLAAGRVHKIISLTDHDKIAALKFRAHQKGFTLSDQVLQFIITYFRRDTGSLFALLDRLEFASLHNKRKITIPFIKSLMREVFD